MVCDGGCRFALFAPITQGGALQWAPPNFILGDQSGLPDRLYEKIKYMYEKINHSGCLHFKY